MGTISNGKFYFTIEDETNFTLSAGPDGFYGYGTDLYETPDAASGSASITSKFSAGEKEKTYYVKGTGTLAVKFEKYVEGGNTPLGAGQLTGTVLDRVASVATKTTSYKELTLDAAATQGTFEYLPIVPTNPGQGVAEGTPTVFIYLKTPPAGYKLHDTAADANVLSTKLVTGTSSTMTITFVLDEDSNYRLFNFQEWGYDNLPIGGGTTTIV